MKKFLLPILAISAVALCIGCGAKDDPAPNAAEKMVTPTGNGESAAANQATPTAPGKDDVPAPLMEPGAPGNEKPVTGE